MKKSIAKSFFYLTPKHKHNFLLKLSLVLFLSFCLGNVYAQSEKQIKGTVTDDKGSPLPGVSVLLKGTTHGTVTVSTGGYVIGVPDGKGILVFSYAGFQPKEVTIGTNPTIDASLISETKALSEVVVTGYSRQSKRDVTGAASTVSADVIAKTPVSDITTALQGRVAGVNVDDQGGPGNAGVIRIRGVGSLGNNDPLYVIDGVQVRIGGGTGSQNIASLLNPNDIESITILKDPSLTAIYGSEGSNGVIVITTKSGKRGEPLLEYSTYLGQEMPRKFPTMITPQEQANALYASYINSGQGFPFGSFYGNGTTPVLPDYIVEGHTPNLGVAAGDPRADPSLYNFNNYRILKANKEGTNWFKTIFKPAFLQNHQLSLSGASDKSNYAVTFGYLDDNGTLINSYFKRLSLRVNTDFKPKPWVRIGENFEFSYTTNNTISTANLDNNQNDFHNNITDIYAVSPFLPTYDIGGHTAGTNGVSAILGGSNPLSGRISSLNSKNYTESALGSAYIEFEPIKNLTFQSKIGAQFIPNQYHAFADSFPQEPIPIHSTYYYEGSSYYTDWRWTNKVAYNITLNSVHKISAFAAYESRQLKSRYNNIVMTNLISNQVNFQYVDDGILDPNFPPSGSGSIQSGISEFGNITYSYLDKYLFSGTVRHDGSSIFGINSKYGAFPAASAGWRISQEKFMENVKWLDDLKVRASWGKSGNDAIPPGQQFGLIRANDAIFGGYDLAGTNTSQILGAYASQTGNPDIKWETNVTTNLGFDATLMKNRLNASFNWFDRKTTDLLYEPPYTGTAGAPSAPYKNIMDFTNKGIELELGFKSGGKSKLTYDMNFNISTYKSKVNFIDGDSATYIDLAVFAPTSYNLTRSAVGRPVSSFFGYVQTGIFQSADDYTNYGVTQPGLNAGNATGHFKFKDISGPNGKPDGVVDDLDQTFLGNPNPKFSFGYNLNLYYQKFDLGFFVQGVYGNKIFNYWRIFSQWPGGLDARSLDTWSSSNTDGKLPIYTQNDINTKDDAVPSSFFIEDGSYLRLKTLQLGYTFSPNKAFKRLRVYVQAFNLLTFTKYSGLDPEVNNGNPGTLGIDFGNAYPNSRKNIIWTKSYSLKFMSMKKIIMNKKYFFAVSLVLVLTACSKTFLDVPPQGQQSLEAYFNSKGVQSLLVGAYHDLTGISTNSSWWSTSGTYWVYGDVTAGDAYTGGPSTLPDVSAIEGFKVTPSTGYMEVQWTTDYDGVLRANNVLIAASKATDMDDAVKTEAVAEARFLRGHYHFNAKVMWNNVPFVDEDETFRNITDNSVLLSVSNTEDIWPKIEADFRFAYNNLPEIQSQVGRVNKWTAACYIAKCYLFEKRFAEAGALLDTIMTDGKNSAGVAYDLVDCFHDSFDASTENNKESVFQIQFSVDDNSFGYNSNLGETGNVPNLYYGPDPFYGYWKRPSFNLVNAFKTDVNGLPMLDASGTDTSNLTNMTNDMGIASYTGFVPYQETVDPRLDWTLGRSAVPYLDWGVDPGQDWAGGPSGQAIGGPYLPMKNVYMASQDYGIGGNNYYAAGGAGSSVNYSIIRYAEVLLWAAECDVENGDLEGARTLVNRVRSRAKNGCSVYIDYSSGYASANYFVDTYNDPWTDQTFARNAVRMERRLELSLEGHRFFDLVRWGIAGDYLNKYLQTEQTRIDHLQGVTFSTNKNEYFPIPQKEIGLNHHLVQNPGY